MEAKELTVGQYFKTSDSNSAWKFKVLKKDTRYPDKVKGQVVIDGFHTTQAQLFDPHDIVSPA
jgi:dolichyl-phosphate-mannose--protein O-mannosyl transferase